MSDWDLPRDPLDALQAGDPQPFEAFVRSHARVLFAFFRRRGVSVTRAEDLTQDVFLKLYQTAPSYRPAGRFAAYCLRVAHNLWIDAHRRTGLRRTMSTDGTVADDGPAVPEPRDPGPGPLARADRREGGARVLAALAQLPEPHRAVIELGVLEERGYAEIAAVLDIPVGTVKSRMHHAVRRLRVLLEPRDAGEGAGAPAGAREGGRS